MPPTSQFEHINIFSTERLRIGHSKPLFVESKNALVQSILRILTPKTTKALPAAWQEVNTSEKGLHWLTDRFNDCELLAIQLESSTEIIGLIVIYENLDAASTIHIGYVIGESHWKKGFASEALLGLVDYLQAHTDITLVLAGVESRNTASVNVLKKSGFTLSQSENGSEENHFYALSLERYLRPSFPNNTSIVKK